MARAPCMKSTADVRLSIFNNINVYGLWVMESRQKLYTTLAFCAGVLITLGFKDFYPDLERRFRSRKPSPSSTVSGAGLKDGDKVKLDDHTRSKNGLAVEQRASAFPEGIEGCIGNTPLFKIRSLSEETGCEILGKAEVCS